MKPDVWYRLHRPLDSLNPLSGYSSESHEHAIASILAGFTSRNRRICGQGDNEAVLLLCQSSNCQRLNTWSFIISLQLEVVGHTTQDHVLVPPGFEPDMPETEGRAN